jgi:hypothetical protein
VRNLRLSLVVAGLAALLLVLAGSAAGRASENGRASESSFTYVALGDSFSSGEGVYPYLRDTTDAAGQPIGNRCDRSTRAYATYVSPRGVDATVFALASGGGSAGADHRYGSDASVRSSGSFTWAFLACSGAATRHVLPSSLGGVGQGGGYDVSPQLDSPVLGTAGLVTITIGGNDAGYAQVLIGCGLSKCNTAAFRKDRAAAIDALEPQLERTYTAVAEKAPNARILVLGYPLVFPATKKEQSCLTLRPFAGEQDMLRTLGTRLNATIASAVTAVAHRGVTIRYVPVAARFAGHEVCGRKGAWVSGILASRTGLGLDPGSFHPNLKGQRDGYAAAVNAALA